MTLRELNLDSCWHLPSVWKSSNSMHLQLPRLLGLSLNCKILETVTWMTYNTKCEVVWPWEDFPWPMKSIATSLLSDELPSSHGFTWPDLMLRGINKESYAHFTWGNQQRSQCIPCCCIVCKNIQHRSLISTNPTTHEVPWWKYEQTNILEQLYQDPDWTVLFSPAFYCNSLTIVESQCHFGELTLYEVGQIRNLLWYFSFDREFFHLICGRTQSCKRIRCMIMQHAGKWTVSLVQKSNHARKNARFSTGTPFKKV